METTAKTESTTKKWLLLLLKIAVTVICLWYVSGKIDFAQAGKALQSANWFYLLLAVVFYTISKVIASRRLNIYFKNIGINLPQVTNLKLYWLGLFYNLFLPGSISGDAYKVILLKKKFNAPYKKTSTAVLLDRLSGLLAIFVLLPVYTLMIFNDKLYQLAAIPVAVVSVLGLYFFIKKMMPDFLPGFFSTFILGILVVAFSIVSALLIMNALGIYSNHAVYIFIFLLATIAAVLPFTLGGLGAREIVFLYFSKYFGLDQNVSVLISLLFYLIVVFTSVWGVLYIFKNPLGDKLQGNEVSAA
jgi:glycosyltransferase 2 family protein